MPLLLNKQHPLVTWILEGQSTNDLGTPATADQLSSGEACSICLEAMRESDTILCMRGCCHLFHTNCIISWIQYHKSCPLCREATTVSHTCLQKAPLNSHISVNAAKFHSALSKLREYVNTRLQQLPIRNDLSTQEFCVDFDKHIFKPIKEPSV